jgi:hypothetical protein
MQVRTTWVVVLVLVVLAACAGDAGDETEVAVSNAGTASIDAVVSDGETELRFMGVAANTTSTFQAATFGSLSALTVSVGNVTSMIALTEGRSNVVNIGADGRVSGVAVRISSGNEGGAAW